MTQTQANTGFYSIHANRLEDLRALIVKICSTEPLAPLQNEMCLVQSNGIAQWLKLGLAQPPERGGLGIAAGFNFSLPSTFIWRAYRSVLSTDAVPDQSSLDKDVLVWRLFRMLGDIDVLGPSLNSRQDTPVSDTELKSVFAPLLRFLQGDNPKLRRFQLAERIALLFDQYQVYRADWLAAWELGKNVIYKGNLEQAVPSNLLWQPVLWRLLLEEAGESHASSSRASVHQRFMEKAKQIEVPTHPELLPKRIIVFGISAMPQQILEALQMVSKFTRVVFCVANPCQYYWGDIISERDAIMGNKKAEVKRRQRLRQDQHKHLVDLPLEELHQQANPLLASLGKQGRDYIRLLEEFDGSYAEETALGQELQNQVPKISDRLSVFVPYAGPNGGDDVSLLSQIQNDIFDLSPVDELLASKRTLALGQDSSLVFHAVHSEQRELEVLHDQLLAAFNQDPSLKPSDILVMTPDINKYSPHINAVFGLFDRSDKRYIPFAISDQGLRDQDPNVIAFEHLLSLDKSRFTYSELISLLELPAIAQQFDIDELDLDIIKRWCQGANIRWGLDAKHREEFVQNPSLASSELHLSTWQAGLRAMLLGYSMPDGGQWAGELAYSQVGGLEVKLIGQLIEFVDALGKLKAILEQEHTPAQWQAHIQHLLDTFFAETELTTLAIKSEITKQSEKLVKHIQQAGTDEQVLPIDTVKDLLLDGLDGASLNHRFLMGSVNFATLMPMRAIPFKRVYILGMNDGAFPRQNKAVDFDLMANDYRPGDRSMREDDRYLFLEALLAARESLYISWVGRSIKDDSERPPSLLISQLIDYINKFWRLSSPKETPLSKEQQQTLEDALVSDSLTSFHPLQPFSEHYFKQVNEENEAPVGKRPEQVLSPPLFTYVREWRAARNNDVRADSNAATSTRGSQCISLTEQEQILDLNTLTQFLKKPVESFFKQSLLVNFDASEQLNNDRETFTPSHLEKYGTESQIIDKAILSAQTLEQALGNITNKVEVIAMSGELGLASTMRSQEKSYTRDMKNLAKRYFYYFGGLKAQPEKRIELDYSYIAQGEDGKKLILEGIVGNFAQTQGGEFVRLLISKSKTKGTKKRDKMRFDNLLGPWLEHLACHAKGESFTTRVLAKEADVSFVFYAIEPQTAKAYLDDILSIWVEGMQRPLPLESRAGFAWVDYVHAEKLARAEQHSSEKLGSEQQEHELAKRKQVKEQISKQFEDGLAFDEGYYRRAFGKHIDFIASENTSDKKCQDFEQLSERLYLPLVHALEEQIHE